MAERYTRRINLYINGKEVRNDVKSIRGEMAKLTNEQARMVIGSDQYLQHAKKIKQLKGIMAQHVQEISNVKKGWSLQGMADGFNKYFGIITAAMASFAGAALTIKSSVQAYAEFDDKLADVMKTTGLTKDQVKSLNGELEKIDTRSAQTELLDLARVAGKLGITSEEEIFGFVRAADKIKVALSEDLGGDVEESINQLGKLVDIFKLKDEFGIEDALIKIGSAINSLGAAGTANEAYMVEFSKRLAGIAPAAGMSIQEVLGLAATLDELGQTSEVSGTAIVQVIGKMFKDTAAYANIAGMSIEDFTTLLNTDANEAFIKLLEGARGSGTGFGEMAKNLQGLGLDGARSTAVLGVLADNIDKLREKQAFSNSEFEKGTSIITEFNTKNQSAQAQLEKAKKAFTAMQVELGERLSPAYTSVIHKSSTLLKILGATVEFLFKYGRQLAVIVATITAYTIAVKAAAFWEGTLNKEKGIGLLLTKTGIALNRAASAAMLLYQAAVAALAGNFAKATRAMQLFWAFSKLTPIGLIAGAVTALAGAFIIYSQRVTEAMKLQRMLNAVNLEAENQIIDQKLQVEQLMKVARDDNRAKADRIAAIDKLNQISPEYLKWLTLETINTDAAKLATDKYIDSLRKKAKIQAAEEQIKEIDKQLNNLEAGNLSFWEKAKSAGLAYALGLQLQTTRTKDLAQLDKFRTDKAKELNLQREKLFEITTNQINLDNNAGSPGSGAVDYTAQIKAKQLELEMAAKMPATTDAEIEARTKKIAAINLEIKALRELSTAGDAPKDLIMVKEQELETAKQMPATTKAEIAARNKKVEAIEREITALKELGTTKQGDSAEKVSDEAIKKRVEEIEAANNAEMAAINRRHLDGLTSDDQYNGELLAQELKFLADKMKVYKVGSKEYEEAVNKSLELQVTADKQVKDLLLKAEQELASAKIENIQDEIKKQAATEEQRWLLEKAALEERLNDKENLSADEIALNDTNNKIIEEKEAEHQQKMKGLKAGENIPDLENLVEAATPVDPNFAPLDQQQAFFDARLALIEAQYEKEKQLAGNNKAALLAADKKYQRDSYQVKSDQIDAEYALLETRIGAAQSYVGMLSSVVDQESALGKALFLFNQGLAIGEIWINIAKANAKAIAASPLTMGQPWVTVNTAQGAIQTALVVAQTVAKFSKSGKKEKSYSDGGPTGDGGKYEPAGIVHKGEWVAPKWMIEHPQLGPHIAVLEAVRKRKSNAVGLLNSPPDSGVGNNNGTPQNPPLIPPFTKGDEEPASGNKQQATSNQQPSSLAIAALKTFREKQSPGPSAAAVKTFSSGGYTSGSRVFSPPSSFKEGSALDSERERGGSYSGQQKDGQPPVNVQVNTDPAILAKLDELNKNISNLKIYTAIEDIKKGDKKYTEIQNTRGL